MKKILFISAFPPNRSTAGQHYLKELLYSLSDEYSIDLVCFSYPGHDVEMSSKINLLKIINVSGITKIYSWLHLPFLHPFFVSRFRFRLLFYLRKKSSHYDFIYFDFSQVFIYSLFIKHSFKILMCHDIIYQKLRRDKYFFLNPFNLLLSISEKLCLKSADLILTFSPKDRLLLKDKYRLNASIVHFFINDSIKAIDYGSISLTPRFCFFGAWNRQENSEGLLWFLNEIYPLITNNIQFTIIGPGLDKSIVEKIETAERIQYAGFLDNPYVEIARSTALIAPIFRGAGVKVKVLESLGTGTPVVGTEIAFEGICDPGGGSFHLCTTAEEFIHTINNFPTSTIGQKKAIKLLFDTSYAKNDFKTLLKTFH